MPVTEKTSRYVLRYEFLEHLLGLTTPSTGKRTKDSTRP